METNATKATKKQSKKALALAGTPAVNSVPETAAPAAVTETAAPAAITAAPAAGDKKMQITLTKRNVEKSGNVAYAREGVRASVYFNKNMFGTGAAVPESITISVDGDTSPFAEPGETKPVAPKMTKEQRIAALAKAREARKNETPMEKATRLRALADKALAQANKAAEKAAGKPAEAATAQASA